MKMRVCGPERTVIVLRSLPQVPGFSSTSAHEREATMIDFSKAEDKNDNEGEVPICCLSSVETWSS